MLLIPIIVVIGSVLGLIGYFTHNTILFYLGGIIPLIDMTRYWLVLITHKYKHDLTVSSIFGLIGGIIVQTIILIVIWYFFSWEGFIWIGVVGGLGYIYSFIKK